jgi:hypothetical protein
VTLQKERYLETLQKNNANANANTNRPVQFPRTNPPRPAGEPAANAPTATPVTR